MGNWKKRILTLCLAAALALSLIPAAFAAEDAAVQAADELYALGLFQGTGTDGNGLPVYDLDRAPTRHEAVTMLVRLLGKETEALAGSWDIPFTDVADWARPYVGYAYANGLTQGTSATAYSGQDTVTASQYITFVLRAMGYSSQTDFAWDRAWELSDELGLTNGEYGEGGGSFLRGDVALISLAALDGVCKDGSLLGESLSGAGSTMTQADYLARSLSDSQLEALKDASPQELRSALSTLGDALAWLDSWEAEMYTALTRSGDLRLETALLGLEDGLSSGDNYTALCSYFLSDDYPAMRCVLGDLTDRNGSRWLLSALALPVKEGFLILSPAAISRNVNNANCIPTAFESVTVPDLTALDSRLCPGNIGPDAPLEHIYVADAGQTELDFALTDTSCTLHSGTARPVYVLSQEELLSQQEAQRLAFARESREQVEANWSRYGMTDALLPTLSWEEAQALYGQDLDTVARAVKTLGDCIYYYAAAGTRAEGVDLTTHDSGDLFWHYNYAPQVVLKHNYFNCGASSSLTARLLEGDYDQVGIIGITFALGEGGGHVINYIQSGDTYYVFDMVNLVSARYQQEGFLLTPGDTLQAAALDWSGRSPWTERLMHAYVSFDGDAPVGWDRSNVSYLSRAWEDTAEILMETPSEGYVYQWRDISQDVQADIDRMRLAS